MSEYKCAFSATLITEDYGCRCAQRITRRGGPDIGCESQEAHQRCAQLFERLKQSALPAFGVEDDLTVMPHSVLVRIQFGGLRGLQRILKREDTCTAIEDICALVDQSVARYGTLEAVPCQDVVEDITAYQLRRRAR